MSPAAVSHTPPSALTPLDLTRLREAIALAESSFGLTEPNPRVGCVLGRNDGTVLGRGATQQAGGPHAEVMALRDAAAAGADVRGATAWVTLEPCAHHGRTPPCCDALVAAGIARVVLLAHDPYPEVDGRGTARLRAAGIEVVEADRLVALAVSPSATDAGAACAMASHPAATVDGALASTARHDSALPSDLAADIAAVVQAAYEVNIGFFSRVRRGRPWVRMKVAASLDGFTALPDGASQWITGPAARADGHAWRRRASAVLTGIGTVLEDDPRLDVRLVPTPRQPRCVVVDSRLQTPPQAALLTAVPGRAVTIYTAAVDAAERAAALQGAGAELRSMAGAGGKVDLAAMLADLAQQGVNELHVEAGHKLNGSLLRAGLVDELLVYLAPRLLGAGRGFAAFGPLARLDQSLDFRYEGAPVALGDDLRLRLRRRGSPPA